MNAKSFKVTKISELTKKNSGLDIGPETVKEYLRFLKSQKIVVWNGPLGYFENKNLTTNSQNFAKALAKLPAKTIVGGGETVAMLSEMNLLKKFDFVSTGGGAMISFLEGKKLPALEVLYKK